MQQYRNIRNKRRLASSSIDTSEGELNRGSYDLSEDDSRTCRGLLEMLVYFAERVDEHSAVVFLVCSTNCFQVVVLQITGPTKSSAVAVEASVPKGLHIYRGFRPHASCRNGIFRYLNILHPIRPKSTCFTHMMLIPNSQASTPSNPKSSTSSRFGLGLPDALKSRTPEILYTKRKRNN